MERIILEQKDIYKGTLLLVNREYPIHCFNNEKHLHLVQALEGHPEILLEKRAGGMLQKLITHLKSKEAIIPVSGFRPLKEQEQIYKDSLAENGREFTNKYVALPGHSEHQTGYAIDLAKINKQIDFICPDFPYDGICGKFREHAADYGFIERYLEGKEHITGISHEPWHFRYVGYPHSAIISSKGYTLEEYIEELKGYPYDGRHLLFEHKGQEIEIFYVNVLEAVYEEILLKEEYPYQISGNNQDGVIVTVWRG
jgi:zinc D-Ala-D-Ala dipeptidase/carboxypeptidase